MKLSDFNLPFGFKREWIKWGLIDHIIQSPSDDKELSDHEAFEIKLYLELHLLGLKQENITRISRSFHSWSKGITPHSWEDKTYSPACLDDYFAEVRSGDIYFLLIDYSGNFQFIQDELLFSVMMKDEYLANNSANIILSFNNILKTIGIEAKQKKYTRIKKELANNLQRMVSNNVENIRTIPNGDSEMVYNLIKKPKRTIIVNINQFSHITSIQEISYKNCRKVKTG